jgi:Fe-S cluster assembly protein SufB/Fe-S cluster assembly protein SufD
MAEFALDFAREEAVLALGKARREPEWLLKDRLRALEAFQAIPVEPNPTFTRHTDIRGVNVAGVEALETDASPGDVELDGRELSAEVEVRQGRVERVVLSKALEEHGAYVGEAMGLKPELAKASMARPEGLPSNDKFGQMCRALFGTALAVYLPPGLHVKNPILLRWNFSGEGRGQLTRTLVHVSRGTRASLIEEFSSAGEGAKQSLFGNAGELFLEDNASLRYASVELFADNVVSFMTRQASLGEGATLRPAYGSFGGFYTKHRADTYLVGRGSTIQQIEVVYGRGQERFDNTDYVVHVGADTVGLCHTKAAMQEKSRSVLKGIMTIQDSGINADSYLSQYAMLLSRQAKSSAIPSLEIKTNNVQRAKHSASVAQVDEEQVYYLMSRGLPRGEAQRMLVESFLYPLVEQIEFPQARDRLWELIHAKWAG